jgi:hypothetical protein
MALLLVSLRFWSVAQLDAPRGLGPIAVDAKQNLLIQVGDKWLLHNRAGVAQQTLSLASFDLGNPAAIAFLETGELLVADASAGTPSGYWLKRLGFSNGTSHKLMRCQLESNTCKLLKSYPDTIVFALDTRNSAIHVAHGAAKVLEKLSLDGELIASSPLELNAAAQLVLQEGLLYLTQVEQGMVWILKPDTTDYGRVLDEVTLRLPESSDMATFTPVALTRFEQHWWLALQSVDGSRSSLYQFNHRWRYVQSPPLPPRSHPDLLIPWGQKILVGDETRRRVYRFGTDAQGERDFRSESMEEFLGEENAEISLSKGFRAAIVIGLLIAVFGLLVLAFLQGLRDKLYVPPIDAEEVGFDINDADIEWLEPASDVTVRLQRLGLGVVAVIILALLTAFVVQLSLWNMTAIALLLIGLGVYYYSLLRSSRCHLGARNDQLILVDHTNTYRVGRDSKIQYFTNYVMIDDVIIYLGNGLVRYFAQLPLTEKFQPLVNRGIKIDRATLQLKLLLTQHPLLFGRIALLLSFFCATMLLVLR